MYVQKGLCCLKGFEHVCACVRAIAARWSLEVGSKGRKKPQGQPENSELSEKAEGICCGGTVLAGNRGLKNGGRR